MDADTSYWLNTVGQFCPWSGQPLREVNAPVGVGEELLQLNVRIYPNPTDATLYISASGNEESTIELYNLTGERVLAVQRFTDGLLDVSHLPAGMYKITITTARASYSDKVVIME